MGKIVSSILLIALLIATAWVWFFFYACTDDWCLVFEWQKINATNSFGECAARGFLVELSYPPRCRAGDKMFIQGVGNELEKRDLIRVSAPRPNEIVSSPLVIEGQARGIWFFEASFPIRLLDSEGNQIAQSYATAQDEWMTEDFVSFRSVLEFSTPATDIGTLILEKDNPSDLPEHADQISIPVRFR